MAIFSLTDFASFINQQIRTQEQIGACLWRLKALMTVSVMTGDFYSLPDSILHNYFSMVSDLIEEVAETHQMSLNELLKKIDENVF